MTATQLHVPKPKPTPRVNMLKEKLKRNGNSMRRPGQLTVPMLIDCEMGIAQSGERELIRIALIDYFTSAVLVDHLVYPDVEIQDYNPRFPGVNRVRI
jgi:hypothetical protein